MDFYFLAQHCAPDVSPVTARAIVDVESGFDPLAIHVNGGILEHPPRSLREALATARALRASGWDFDIGLAQINVRNVERFRVALKEAFDPCTNLHLMQRILGECFERAHKSRLEEQIALRAALSCYHSGNLQEGFARGYVGRIVNAAKGTVKGP